MPTDSERLIKDINAEIAIAKRRYPGIPLDYVDANTPWVEKILKKRELIDQFMDQEQHSLEDVLTFWERFSDMDKA